MTTLSGAADRDLRHFFPMHPLFGILAFLWTLAGVSLVGGIIPIVLSFQVKGLADKAA